MIIRLAALSALLAMAAGAATVWDGVYRSAQAKRGEAAYGAACARCHRDDLSGYNGVLVGGQFMDRWREDSLESFFRDVRMTMPRDAPNSLAEDTYLDIVAYILSQNRFPAGQQDLTVAALPGIRVQAKQGPEPVPDFALVSVTGCMSQTADGNWIVLKATEPVRTREPGKPAAAEVEALAAAPPGTHTFRLMDITSVESHPAKDVRVAAKGFLMRQPDGDRINLTSLQTIAATCP